MHRLHDLPDSLHSTETDEPFQHCSDCGGKLSASVDGYLLQKVYSKGEVIMEIAVCVACHDRLQQQYSVESRERIWNFWLDHVDFPGRLRQLRSAPVHSIEPWISSCVACRRDRDDCEEFVVVAQAVEDQIVHGELPLMMCLGCQEKIVELLSDESLGIYDEWKERCLPMAPAVDGPGPKVRVFM